MSKENILFIVFRLKNGTKKSALLIIAWIATSIPSPYFCGTDQKWVWEEWVGGGRQGIPQVRRFGPCALILLSAFSPL